MDQQDDAARPAGRGADGRFGPGNPGRPRGARNLVTKALVARLLAHFEEHESHVLDTLSRYFPVAYARLLTHFLPADAAAAELDLEALSPTDRVAFAYSLSGVGGRLPASPAKMEARITTAAGRGRLLRELGVAPEQIAEHHAATVARNDEWARQQAEKAGGTVKFTVINGGEDVGASPDILT